jgi:hypothetical protein
VTTLVVLTVLIEFVEVWRLISAYERPPMAPDAGVFQHIGWYLTNGGRLYVDVWEPKLPLPFETTAFLALIAGDDMYLYHYLNVGLMVLAVVGIVLLVGALTHRLTDDALASTVAGLSLFLLPGFAVRPAYGFKAKYLLLLTGLLAVYLILNDHPVASGVMAAASVGYWQLGVIFPLIVVGLAFHRSDLRTAGVVVLSGSVFAVVMLVPVVVLWQSTSEMVAQVVVIPMLADDSASLFERIVAGVVHFKWASPFVLLGVYGLVRGAREQLEREDWWLLAGAGWFGFVILFVDFDVGGYTDLIPGLAFVAIGIGLLSARLTAERLRDALTAALVGVVVLNVVAYGAVGLAFPAVDTPAPAPMDDLRTNERARDLSVVPDDTHDVRYYYWNREVPETCHYRLSLMEVNWLQSVGTDDLSGCSDLQEVQAA